MSLLTLSAWAFWERDTAIAQRDRALAGRLAAQANLLLADPQQGSRVPILLAAHSFRFAPTPQASRALAEGMRRLPPELLAALLESLTPNTIATGVVFSPKSRYLAVTTHYDVVADVFDVGAKRKIASLKGGVEAKGSIGGVAFANDETSFAVVWNGDDGRRRLKLFEPGKAEPDWDSDWRNMLSFAESDSGWRVAWIDQDKGLLVVIDPMSRRTALSVPLAQTPTAVGLSPDGKFAAFAIDRRLTVLDMSGGSRAEIDLPAPVSALAVAPGGTLVAVTEPGGGGAVWATAEGRKRAGLSFKGAARAIGFTKGGRYLQIVGEGGLTTLETNKFRPVAVEQRGDASGSPILAQALSERNPPVDMQFVRDERAIFVARRQGDLILWSDGLIPSFGMYGVIFGLAPVFSLNHESDIEGASISENAERVVSYGGFSGMSPGGTMIVGGWTARIWDGPARLEIARIESPIGSVAALDPTGAVLVTAEASGMRPGGGTLRLWQIPPRPPLTPLSNVWSPLVRSGQGLLVALDGGSIVGRSHDSRLMLGRSHDSRLMLGGAYSAQTLPFTASKLPQPWLADVYGMTGDSRLLFAKTGATVKVFDIASRRSVDRIASPREVAAAAASYDGRYVAITHLDKENYRDMAQRALLGGGMLKPGELVTAIWDRQQGKWLWNLHHREFGFVRAVSRDGRRVLIERWTSVPNLLQSPLVRVSGMPPVRVTMDVWDARDDQTALSSMPIDLPTRAASFDSSGALFVVALNGQTALVGASATGEEIAAIEPYGRVTELFNPAAADAKQAFGSSVGFSDDGKSIVTAGATAQGAIFTARYPWRSVDLVSLACARLPEGQRELSAEEERQYFGDMKPLPVCGGSPLEHGSLSLWGRFREAVNVFATRVGFLSDPT